MSVQVLHGNALALPLSDDSVDLVVTSPPYFGLRSYQDGGEHYDGQIGSEATPAEFVDALIAATAEMVRVVKPSGSIWVNLGDRYSGGSSGQSNLTKLGERLGSGGGQKQDSARMGTSAVAGMRPKSLIGVPWRYALRCIDDLGLILRAEVIWSKPNGLPESVTDRVRRSHETWFSFQQSGGVEATPQSFPFCPLCGRPVDARTTLIERLKEGNSGVVPDDLAHHVRPQERVQADGAGSSDLDHGGVPRGAGVASLVERDLARVEDRSDLLEDQVVAVVDHDAQVRVPAGSACQSDRPLAVDDASEPSQFCRCVGHPFIIDDEPWIPQNLAAELMQMVADGTADAQNVADFLSGDFARTHSTWFHFTLNPRYYSAVDEIREEGATIVTPSGAVRYRRPGETDPGGTINRQSDRYRDEAAAGSGGSGSGFKANNPLGKLPGSVWTIPTQPLTVPPELGVDHFAAFPMEWPRRIVTGWSPREVCTACGEGRRPVVAKGASFPRDEIGAHRNGKTTVERGDGASVNNTNGQERNAWRAANPHTITGYACACPPCERFPNGYGDQIDCLTHRRPWGTCTTAPATPGVVLDPFGGTGTTALVAHALGRHGISVDMSADYCRLAEWRTSDPQQLARAQQREYTPPREQVDGQETLFEGLGA